MKKKNKCLICNKKFLEYLNLGYHPCADTFINRKIDSLKLKKYPLVVGFCKCNHLTSIYNISPYERYKKNNYSYTSDNSPVSKKHFDDIAKKIFKNFLINNNKSVIEIGSNDGTFLKNIKKYANCKVLGIDPSNNMCKLALKKKISSLNIFFNYKNSKIIKNNHGKFDVLYGANVFNHVDDPINFLKGCKNIVKRSGNIILEVPDLNSLIKSVGFDTIYHEHRHYFSRQSISKLFEKVNINLIKIDKIGYMAGSLRIYSKNEPYKKNKKYKFNYQVQRKNFLNFKIKISLVKKKIIEFVRKNSFNGKIVIGLGAATKGNTLLNFCNLDYNDINCVLDNSPHKIGKFMPGSGIKILDETKFKKYDAALILPWNITKHLYKKFLKNRKISYTSIAKIVKDL